MGSYYAISLAGSVLVYISTLGFILASLFAHDLKSRAFANGSLAVVALIGLLMNAFSAVIVSFLTIFIGLMLLAAGVLLFAMSSYWQAILLEKNNFNLEKPAYMLFVGMLTIIGGMVPIMLKARQLFKWPLLAPHNMLTFMSLSFFSGAICYLVTSIEAAGWVDDTENIHDSTAILGSVFFNFGALFLIYDAAMFAFGLDLIIQHRYFSTYLFATSAVAVHVAAPIMLTCLTLGSLLVIVGTLFGTSTSTGYVRLTGFLLLTLAYIAHIVGIALGQKRLKKLMTFNVFIVCGFIVYGIGCGIRVKHPQAYEAVLIVGACLLIVGFCSCTYSFFKLRTSSQLPGPANYAMHSFVLQSLGAICLLIAATETFTFVANVESTRRFGDILIVSGTVILIFHVAVSREASLISIFTKKDMKLARAKFIYTAHEMNRTAASKDAKKKKDPEPDINVDVVVVGAGPVGLGLANALGKFGLRVMIIETREDCIPDSRFFNLNSNTMEIYDRLGIVDAITAAGVPQEFGYSSVLASGMTQEDRRVFKQIAGTSRKDAMEKGMDQDQTAMSETTGSVHASQQPQRIMQSQHERALLELAKANPNIDVRYGWSAEKLDDRPAFCNVYIRPVRDEENEENGESKGNERESKKKKKKTLVRCRFVGACDGANSFCSNEVGLKFDGLVNLANSRSTLLRSFKLLEKVRDSLGECLQYHICREGVGAGVFVCCSPDAGLWTFHLFCLWDGSAPRTIQDDQMEPLIEKFLGPVQFEIIYKGRWYWNYFVARFFSKGNVYFAGDAVHSHTPFGGLGGNTGTADINNLAWKMAACVKGWGGELMMKSYEEERRIAALRTSMYVMHLSPRPDHILLATRLIFNPFLQPLLTRRWAHTNTGFHNDNHFSSSGIQLGIRYDFSSIIYRELSEKLPGEDPPCIAHPRVIAGARLPIFPLGIGDHLLKHLDNQVYTLLYVSRAEGHVGGDRRRSSFGGVPKPSATDKATESIRECFAEYGAPLKLLEMSGMFSMIPGRLPRYYAGKLMEFAYILVRPDGFVGWCTKDPIPLEKEHAHFVVSACLGWSAMSRKMAFAAECANNYLTDKFIKELGPLLNLFPMAAQVVNEPKSNAVKIARQKSADFTVITKAEVQGGPRTEKRGRIGTVFTTLKNLGGSAAGALFRRRATSKPPPFNTNSTNKNQIIAPKVLSESSSEEDSEDSDEGVGHVNIVVDEIEINEEDLKIKPQASSSNLAPPPKFLKSRSQARLQELKASNPRLNLQRNDSQFGLHRSDSMAKGAESTHNGLGVRKLENSGLSSSSLATKSDESAGDPEANVEMEVVEIVAASEFFGDDSESD